MQTQDQTVKKSRPKNLKLANGMTLALPCINKPKKTSHQNKKKEYLKKKQNQKNSILATRDNTIKNKKKWNN